LPGLHVRILKGPSNGPIKVGKREGERLTFFGMNEDLSERGRRKGTFSK